LKAVGRSNLSITSHYLGFGVMTGLTGGVLGTALGLWLQSVWISIYTRFYNLPDLQAQIRPGILAMGLSISVGFAFVGTIRAVRVASRLDPAVSMRPPPPERGGRILPERIGFLWGPLPFRWKMILRAVFRNPFRSAVGLLAAIISTALVLTSLAMVDSLDFLIRYQFERVSHEDVAVSTRDPEALRSAQELAGLPGVSLVEGELGVPCDLTNGPRSRRLGVIGLREGNRLHTPLDAAGQPVRPPKRGLLLSRKLAEILDVARGDVLQFRPLIGRREMAEAQVAGIVETFLGLAAYADAEYLAGLIGENQAANRFLLDTWTEAASEPLLAELRRRPAVIGYSERRRDLRQIREVFSQNMGAMISIMVLFSALIAFGAVLNAALVSLNERRREVGTLRVLGYTTRQVWGIFSGESAVINGVGIFVGLFAGIGLARLLSRAYDTELYRFPILIPPERFWQTVLIMIVFVGAAQLLILWMIRKLDWLAVLQVKE
ncbi:ABC transporter permease, partial [bacterium]|nr:ABC transporter permease [bacterium]